ncbi:MAG: transcription termination factor NusA [Pygmaiobacter massiliensis]|nr:transcription termination factor NusA [Pygmaiobacter massiliensis]
MNNEFFEALRMLEKERGISEEYLIEKIRAAIVIAVKKGYDVEENVDVVIEPSTGKFSVAIVKEIVDEVEDPRTQMTLEEAKVLKPRAKVGTRIEIPLKTKEFGRIAAQTAKHVIRQALREAERSQMYAEMQSKAHEIVTAVVNKVDPARGIVVLELEKGEAILPKNEQVPGEELHEGERIKVYVVDVTVTDKGPKTMISRTHPGLVKRMFEMEVPEIFDGTVEVKAIAREAGMRTKMAVYSKDPNVDPVGACIGARGARVAKIVEELDGEKIDIVPYSEDPAAFIAAALSPASVVKVEILPGEVKSCKVTVPDNQLSLAIGNKGQNARLTARLTGYNIDSRPESGYYGEDESETAD